MNIEELKEFVDYISQLESDKGYWKQKYYETTEQLRIANEKIAECNRIMKLLAKPINKDSWWI